MENSAKKQDLESNYEDKISNYIRVGDEYLKRVNRPDKTGVQYPMYVKRSRQTILDDFDKKSLYEIKKFDGFVNVPAHINYKQVIHGYFNEYYKLNSEPKKGECTTILELITHIFGAEYYHFALDYLQLLYTQPLQQLPVLLLESNEKGTGKSSFGVLLRLMFEENTIILGNNDLDSDFNGYWIKRLAIVVDETSLEKNAIMQMIKRLSTEKGRVTTNEKNKAQSQIDFFGKFIFMSNQEGKALPIEKGDNRFAVFKVPKFEETGLEKIPDIEPIFKAEIPAFLYFLQNRDLIHPKKDRMYFSPEIYQTKQLKIYMTNTVSYTAKAIFELVKDTFLMLPDENELSFSVANIINELEKEVRYLSREKVKKALEIELEKTMQPKGRYTFCSLKSLEASEGFSDLINKQNNVHYTFNRKDVFS